MTQFSTRSIRNPLCVLALLSLPACVGTEVGNPQDTEVSIDMVGYDSQQTRSNALTLSDGYEITSAHVLVESVELRSAESCEGTSTDLIEGPFVIDLLGAKQGAPDISRQMGLAARELCRIKVRLGQGFPHSVVDDPEGDTASIHIEGVDADKRRFQIFLPVNETFVLKGSGASLTLAEGEDHLIFGFALDQWLDDEVFQNASPELDGSLRFDAMHNQRGMARIKQNLRDSLKLFRDRDNDRKLSPDKDELLAIDEGSPSEKTEED